MLRLLSGPGYVRHGRQVMRRNNGWLAVLAVSLLLSILHNSLAGERYPLDYDNAELPVNLSKTTYGTYNSNEPSLNSRNYLNPSSVPISSKSSTSTTTPLQSHLHINKKNTILSKGETKAITRRATKLSDINLPGENFNNDRSIHDDLRQSKLVDPNERSRNVRASESSEQVVEGSNSLSLEIPEQPHLSSWIPRGAIRNISRRINRVRLSEPSKTREHKTTTEAIRRGSVLLDKGYSYYDHVRAISHDDDSLTTSEGQITGVKKRERSMRDSHQRKRSDKANALQIIPNISLGETNSFKDSKSQDERQKVIKKRFLTGYSVFSVSLNRRLNGNLKANKLIIARKSKGRRENGKKRFGRSVRYLKKKPSRNINLEPWYALRDSSLSNSDPRNDIFKTGRGNHHSSRAEGFRHHSASHKSIAARRHAENTREFNGISPKQRSTIGHDDLGDKGTHSSSIREKRNFVLAGDVSDSLPKDETLENVTFHGTMKSSLENEINNHEGNIVEELKYDLVQDNFTENLIDQRQHKLEELDGNDTKVHSVTLKLRNESHSERHNFSIQITQDSINRTKLEESSASGGNYSNLVANILTSSNESNLRGDDVNPVSISRTKLEESNVETYSHLDLINQATLKDANTSKGNYSRLMTSIFTLTNKSDSINHDTNSDSINRTLVKSYISNRNYSKTNTLKASNESSSIIQDTNENSIDKIELKKSLNNQKFASTAPTTINLRLNTDTRNSNNESVLMSPNTNNDLIDGMELDASWAEIDESQEGAIQTGEEERSMLSSVTKESENVFVNSPRGSVTAQRNSTHLRHDMNSLAEGSFVFKSNGLFQITGRNANDPFSNSSTMQHGRKMAENFNVNTLPDQLLVNNEKQTESKLSLIPFQLPNVSETVTFKEEEKANSRSNDKVVSKSSKINDKAVSVSDSQESRSIGHDKGKSNQRRLNGSLIVLGKDKSVDSRLIELLDQNTPTNTDEIKANEPTIRSSLKNDRGADELADETTKDVNPVERGNKIVDNPEDRVSEDSTTLSTILINDRFSKERKSRSSKIGTSMKLRRNFTMEVEGTVVSETSTSILNKHGVGQNNVPTLNIDPTLAETGNDTTVASQVTLNDSLEFVSRNSSIVLTLMDQTTKDYFLTTNNVMLSSTEVDQMQMDIETSTISLSNDEDQLLSFDTIVTSLEPNDEDSRVTEDVPLRNMDNSSHKLQSEEPPWPVKHSAVVEGDLVLGGLMMVHEREDYYTCGPVMPQGGVQALEAMLYTLDTLNDREIVPGVKIGAHILDDCDKDTYGLEMAVDFIKGTYMHVFICLLIEDW